MMKGSSFLPHIVAKRLEGKVAIITGGASGFGESTAKLFAKHGAKAIVADVQNGLGRVLCEDVRYKDALSFVHCDVTSDYDVQNAVDTAMAKYGKLDIMFSNAGIGGKIQYSRILDIDHEDFKNVFDVNVFGAFLCAKHAARVMVPAKKGSILFTSSAASVVAGAGPHVYAASKHAIVGLTKNLCVELGNHGIRVNCISPFAAFTPLFSRTSGIKEKEDVDELIMGSSVLKEEVAEAEDVAEAAVYLGSDESKYVSGLNLVIDGGYSTTNPSFGEAMKKRFSS